HPLVPADCPFRQGTPIVAAVLLPADTAALRDLLQMPITLRRRGVRDVARHGGPAWRHNNRGLRMTFGNCVVDIVPVVRPITSKRSDRTRDLIEQRADPRTVVDIFGRLVVSSVAMIYPVSASTPMWSFLQK